MACHSVAAWLKILLMLGRLARVPAGWNHPAEKDKHLINMLEHVPTAKPLHTLAGHALIGGTATGGIKYGAGGEGTFLAGQPANEACHLINGAKAALGNF